MFDMDEGNSGSQGPWVSWKARGNRITSRENFEWRGLDGDKRQFDEFREGVVADIDNLKTGWCHTTGEVGVAPQWKWNASIRKFEPRPGEDWKKGLSLPLAIRGGGKALWEDASFGGFQALVKIVPALADGSKKHPGKLPVLRLVGAEEMRVGKGDTAVANLQVVQWVDRPESLDASFMDEGEPDAPAPASAGFSDFNPRANPAAAAQSRAAAAGMQAPQAPNAPAQLVDDEIPF